MKEPSEKQIRYATSIAEKLGINIPEEFSSKAYYQFISENKEKFDNTRTKISYDEDAEDWVGYLFVR